MVAISMAVELKVSAVPIPATSGFPHLPKFLLEDISFA
jgi:hypothetical protein